MCRKANSASKLIALIFLQILESKLIALIFKQLVLTSKLKELTLYLFMVFAPRHVSDVGIQGFKFLCQHKVLQSAYMDPLLCRVYPPTLLEWKAIERKANMALDVRFPDGKSRHSFRWRPALSHRR